MKTPYDGHRFIAYSPDAPSLSGSAGTAELAVGFPVRRSPNGVTSARQRQAALHPPPVKGRGHQGVRGIRRRSLPHHRIDGEFDVQIGVERKLRLQGIGAVVENKGLAIGLNVKFALLDRSE